MPTYASDLVTVMPITCEMPRSGPGQPYLVNKTWVGFSLAGVFNLHARHDDHLIHSGLGVIFPQGIEYRMSHPTNDGDTALALGFAPGVVEEALPTPIDRVRVMRLDLRVRHQVGVLMAAADRRDHLLVEQLALELLGALAAHVAPAPASTASRNARAKVDRIRLLLAEQPEARWTLGILGQLVGYSPYHLAHQFRAHTGTSVHRFLADLRTAAALQRIEAGETSLAAVAADLGFSHHSHLTATLRRRIGLTPRMIREHLRPPSA
jgi:AraC-like DNA-binding protein